MKFPYIQFFIRDHLSDEKLTRCTLPTRGLWTELVFAMHLDGRCGQISGTRANLASIGRCTITEVDAAIHELSTSGAADVMERDGVVTLICRRMKREDKQRKQNKLRVLKSRCNDSVMVKKPPRVDSASGNGSFPEEKGCGEKEIPKRSVADELVESWNSIRGVVGCREMTAKRKKCLAARLASDQWAADWPKALVKLDQSEFCKGGGGQNWRANIDWFLTPDAVTKLLEGKYDNKTEAPRQSDLPVYVAPNRVLRNGA